MEPLETIEYREHVVKIYPDLDPLSPRTEVDNFGTMVCFHRRYMLGDKHDFPNADAVIEHIQETQALSVPLYLYDHGGVTMNTTGFSCPWDSGQVGVIFVTAEQVRKEYGVKRIGRKVRAKALDVLKAEVKEYDDFLTGSVYGYVTEDSDGEHVGSCWGFFGDTDYMIEEAKREVDAILQTEYQEKKANWENGNAIKPKGQAAFC